MAVRQYEHLIKPLSVARTNPAAMGGDPLPAGPGQADQSVWLSGRDHLEGLNLSFCWGIYQKTGNWYSSPDLHTHPYPECHMLVGLDTANVSYLGAEVEFCLGAEQEICTVSEASVVIIPAGLPHGGALTKRVFSPKGFAAYTVTLDAAPHTSRAEAGSAAAAAENPAAASVAQPGGKYSHLVKTLKSFIVTERGQLNPARFASADPEAGRPDPARDRLRLGPGNADHLVWLFGRTDLEGLDLNMDWGFFSRAGLWHRAVGAHIHSTDEVLVFAGTDPADFEALGAEIEIDLGREHERYLVNKPSVVICPASFPHAPIVTRWVDRPFAFFSINLAAASEMQFVD